MNLRSTGRLQLVAIAAATLLASLASAQGGPPFVTDDPGTPGDGNWEINAAVIGSRSPARWDIIAPDLDINYGLGDHVQLKVDVGWAHADDQLHHRMSGFGATDFGIKWRFMDEGKSGFALSVYPQLSVNFSRSSVQRGLTSDGKELFLPMETSTTAGTFSFAAEAGRNLVQNAPDEWLFGAVVARHYGSALELGLEVHETVTPGDSATLVNLGGRWQLSERLSLLTAVGRELSRDSPERQDFLCYLGLQILRNSPGT
jgi:hypothetical protein